MLRQEPAEKSAGAASGEEDPQGEVAGGAGGALVADDCHGHDQGGAERRCDHGATCPHALTRPPSPPACPSDAPMHAHRRMWAAREDDPAERQRVCAEMRHANAKVAAWIQQTKDWEDALARNLSCTQQVVELVHGNDTAGVQTLQGAVQVASRAGEDLGGTDDEIEEDAQAHARKARARAWDDALARTYTHSEDWPGMATHAGKTSRDKARAGVAGSDGAAAAAAGVADAADQHSRSLQAAKGGEDHGEERGCQLTSRATRGVEMLERALAGYSEANNEDQRSHAIWVKRCASRVLNASCLPTQSVRSAQQLAAIVSRSTTESDTASSNACTVSATLRKTHSG